MEYDGDMGFAVLETKPCPFCFVQLCPCCDARHCQDCGAFVCSSHIVIIEDGTPKPLELCPTCAAEAQQQAFELELELSPAAPGSVRACPQCQSIRLNFSSFHGFISALTGYDDSGEMFQCLECGHSGEVDELVDLPEVFEPVELQPRRAPGRETRKLEPGEKQVA